MTNLSRRGLLQAILASPAMAISPAPETVRWVPGKRYTTTVTWPWRWERLPNGDWIGTLDLAGAKLTYFRFGGSP
jgi:hypothetical protein